VNTAPGTRTTDEDTAVVFTGGTTISIADVDVASSDLEVTLTTAYGTVTLSGVTGLTFSAGDGTSDTAMTFTGTLSAVNAALAGLSFLPDTHFNGTAWLYLTSNDQGNTGSGVALSDYDAVEITVEAMNDAPAGTNNTITINEDTSHTFGVADFGFSDADSNSLLAVKIATLPGAGTLRLDGVNVVAGAVIDVADIAAGLLVFSPVANANGSVYSSFTFQVQDDGGTANGGVDLDPSANTIAFDVTAVNDAPALGTANISLSGIDEDEQDSAGDAVEYIVNGLITDEDVYGPLLPGAIAITGVDYSNGTWQYSLDHGDTWMPMVASASNALLLGSTDLVRFVPNIDWSGQATFTFRAWDKSDGLSPGNTTDTTNNGGATAFSAAEATATIAVGPVNDAPSFMAGGDVIVNEDSGSYYAAWASNINSGADDEAGQLLSFILSNDNNVLFEVEPAIDADGYLTFTPAADANGSTTVTVYLQDDSGDNNASVPISFTITITPVNDTPNFTASALSHFDEDAGLVTIPNWAIFSPGGAADEAGQFPTFDVSNVSNPDLFTQKPMVASWGDLTFILAPDANGASSFDVLVQDDGGTENGGSDTSSFQTFTISVNPINDAPTFTPGGDIIVSDDIGGYLTAWASNISAGPSDEASQNVAFVVANNNSSIFSQQPSIASDGALSFTPSGSGVAVVTIYLQDDGGIAAGGGDVSDAISFSIIINPSSFLPDSDLIINEDAGSQTFAGWATGEAIVDCDNPSLFSDGPNIDPLTGDLIFTPAANAYGVAVVTFASAGTFSITINPINDAPSIAVPGAQLVAEDVSLAIGGIAVSDVEAGSAPVLVCFEVENGELTFDTSISGGLTASQISGNSTTSVSVYATIGAINATLAGAGGLQYLGNSDFNGLDTLTITIDDQGNSGAGGALQDTQSVEINVLAIDDAPRANDDWLSTGKNTPVSFNLLLNDFDVDGDPLTLTEIDGNNNLATPITLANGTLTASADGTITFSPNTGFIGQQTFSYTISAYDVPSSASVTISVANGQWATAVPMESSTRVTPQHWNSSWQILGAPDTAHPDAFEGTAWTTAEPNEGVQTILVGFQFAVQATGFLVREAAGNGFLIKAEFLDENDHLHVVWEANSGDSDLTPAGTVAEFVRFLDETSYLVKGIKLWLNTDHSGDWEGIDAVRLFSHMSMDELLAQSPSPEIGGRVTGEPIAVTFRAPLVDVGNWAGTPLEAAQTFGWTDLDQVTANMVRALSATQLHSFLTALGNAGQGTATVQRHNARAWTGTDQRLKLFIGKVWTWGDHDLNARVLAASPRSANAAMPPSASQFLLSADRLAIIRSQVQGQPALPTQEAAFLAAYVTQVLTDGDGDNDDDNQGPAVNTAILITAALSNPFGNGRSLVDTARLQTLWTSGNAVLAATLNATQIGQRTGQALEAAAAPTLPLDTRTRLRYNSLLRNRRMGRPILLNPDRVITNTVQRRHQPVGVPPVIQSLTLLDSVFIDVKAWNGRVSLSREDYQALGFIDALANSPAARQGVPPMLIYVTTSNTIIGRSVLREATRRGVLLYQAYVFEDPAATAAGQPNLNIGMPIPLNYIPVMAQYQGVNVGGATGFSGVLLPPLSLPLGAFTYP